MLKTYLQRVRVFQSFGDYWRATGERKVYSNRSKLKEEAIPAESFKIDK